MYRASSLFERIVSFDNLRLAYVKARRGKTGKEEVREYSKDIDSNLDSLRRRLIEGTVSFSDYRSFVITDPKRRIISVAPFENRIVHHAIINILEDEVFERHSIFHTYACRKDKGTHRAVREVYGRCGGKDMFFLKLDCHHYFDSIDHDVLKMKLRRVIKDRQCLSLLDMIIDGFEKEKGKGLPIGNLTSQFLANFYLSSLDHHVIERLRPSFYCRYMDDMLVLDRDRLKLKRIGKDIERYLSEELKVTLNEPVLGRCVSGIPFLGYRIAPSGVARLRKSALRKRRKERTLEKLCERGWISVEETQEREKCLWAEAGIIRQCSSSRKTGSCRFCIGH